MRINHGLRGNQGERGGQVTKRETRAQDPLTLTSAHWVSEGGVKGGRQLWVVPEALFSPGPGLFLTVCGIQLALRHSERVQCDGELQLPWLPLLDVMCTVCLYV